MEDSRDEFGENRPHLKKKKNPLKTMEIFQEFDFEMTSTSGL